MAILYTANGLKSYATVSDCLRLDERAVWGHMEPILKELRATNPQIETIHFISDGPLTQYRNKVNFYLLSSVPFLFGFVHITWNYSEKYHGQGASDGVGASVKGRQTNMFYVEASCRPRRTCMKCWQKSLEQAFIITG